MNNQFFKFESLTGDVHYIRCDAVTSIKTRRTTGLPLENEGVPAHTAVVDIRTLDGSVTTIQCVPQYVHALLEQARITWDLWDCPCPAFSSRSATDRLHEAETRVPPE